MGELAVPDMILDQDKRGNKKEEVGGGAGVGVVG